MGFSKKDILERNESCEAVLLADIKVPKLIANMLKTTFGNLGPTINSKEGTAEWVKKGKDFEKKILALKESFSGGPADWAQVFSDAKLAAYELIRDFNDFIEGLDINERDGGGSTENLIEFSFMKDGVVFIATDAKLADLWLSDKNNRKSVETGMVTFADSVNAFLTTNGLTIETDVPKTLAVVIYRMSRMVKKAITQKYAISNPEGKTPGRKKADTPETVA